MDRISFQLQNTILHISIVSGNVFLLAIKKVVSSLVETRLNIKYGAASEDRTHNSFEIDAEIVSLLFYTKMSRPALLLGNPFPLEQTFISALW